MAHEKGREPINTRLPKDLRDYERGDLTEPIPHHRFGKVIGRIGACSLTNEGVEKVDQPAFRKWNRKVGFGAAIPADGDGTWIVYFERDGKRHAARVQRDWFTNWNSPKNQTDLSGLLSF